MLVVEAFRVVMVVDTRKIIAIAVARDVTVIVIIIVVVVVISIISIKAPIHYQTQPHDEDRSVALWVAIRYAASSVPSPNN